MQSTDAAGNQSPANLLSNWTNTLQPGIPYARILSGPWGPTANKSASFSLEVRSYGTSLASSRPESWQENALVQYEDSSYPCYFCYGILLNLTRNRCCAHKKRMHAGASAGWYRYSEHSKWPVCGVRTVSSWLNCQLQSLVTQRVHPKLRQAQGWGLHLHGPSPWRQRWGHAPIRCLQLHC